MTPLDTSGTPESRPVDPQTELARLFADHGTSLYRVCRCTLGSAADAEDVVQDAFLKLLQHLAGARPRSLEARRPEGGVARDTLKG